MLTKSFDRAPCRQLNTKYCNSYPVAGYCNNLLTVIQFFCFSKTTLQFVKLLNLFFRCWHKYHIYLLQIPCKKLGDPQWEEKQLSSLEICLGGEQWAFQTGCPNLLNGLTLKQSKSTIMISQTYAFKYTHLRNIYSKGRNTHSIRNQNQASPPSFTAMKLVPILIPNPATLAQVSILLHIKDYLLCAYKQRPIQTKA